MKNQLRGIYGITDDALLGPDEFLSAVESALKGGVTLLQYRNKPVTDADKRQRLTVARELLQLCQRYQVPLIINDDAELCADLGAQGVHLGQGDGNCEDARKLLGDEAIIGVTCHDSITRAKAAAEAGADYVAFGRFFPSRTKPEASPAALEILSQAQAELGLPIVAIGGINAENGASLIHAGADMLAVIHSLFGGTEALEAAEASKAIKARAQQLAALFD